MVCSLKDSVQEGHSDLRAAFFPLKVQKLKRDVYLQSSFLPRILSVVYKAANELRLQQAPGRQWANDVLNISGRDQTRINGWYMLFSGLVVGRLCGQNMTETRWCLQVKGQGGPCSTCGHQNVTSSSSLSMEFVANMKEVPEGVPDILPSRKWISTWPHRPSTFDLWPLNTKNPIRSSLTTGKSFMLFLRSIACRRVEQLGDKCFHLCEVTGGLFSFNWISTGPLT